MRTIKNVLFAGIFAVGTLSACTQGSDTKTVADLYKDKASLAGQTVSVKGKVVKVNTGLKSGNFLHIQDGSGAEGTNDLTITSKQMANVGDQVTVSGRLVVDKDFGYGYTYELLMEDATITPVAAK